MLGAAPAAAVLVSGFRPRDSRLAVRLAAGPWQASPIRTLHVIGRRDPIVAPAESLALRELLQGAGPAVVCEHRGGHGGWRRDEEAAGQAGALWRPLAPMEGRPAGPTPPRGAELRRTIAEQLGVLEDLVLGARPSRGAPGPAALQRRPRTAPCPRCAHVDIPAAVAVHQDGRPRARGARRPGATDGVGRGPRGRPG
ncbi:unnamed protein product, partial [Prorocentrum cordatum]